MKTHTTEAQRNQVLAMLRADNWTQAEGAVKMLGFDTVTEALEHIIQMDGLHNNLIMALAVYYDNDLKLVEIIKASRKGVYG